jgi:hypothetical protein
MSQYHERRQNDRGFFVLHRIKEALCCDSTAAMEWWLGLIGFTFKGFLLLMQVTSFPPNEVRFLLRQLHLTNNRLGWLLLIFGLVQAFAVATKSHAIRGWLSVIGAVLAMIVSLAYLMADVAPYFQAWVSYAGIFLLEIWLLYRNFKDEAHEEKVQRFVLRRHKLSSETGA